MVSEEMASTRRCRPKSRVRRPDKGSDSAFVITPYEPQAKAMKALFEEESHDEETRERRKSMGAG